MSEKTEKETKLNIFNFEGTKYKTHLTQKFLDRKPWKPKDPNKVLSPIPGTVVKICVKEGQKVSAGRNLYILEAMKMKNRFNAEKAGIIVSIHAKEGDIIPKLKLVMEMEDLPEKKTGLTRSSRSKSKDKK